jgi:hypothetical protein
MTGLSRGIRTLTRAMFEFFVDDGIYPAVMILWIMLAVIAKHVGVAQRWTGILLSLGLDAIFVLSIILHAHRTNNQRKPRVRRITERRRGPISGE